MQMLAAGYQHGYERAGSGRGATWPASFPLMALDHCLLSPRLTVHAYQLHSNPLSDHRAQQVWISP
jgi:endonuclease/exonuclease/phosphatase family metal-dependent hydrolase